MATMTGVGRTDLEGRLLNEEVYVLGRHCISNPPFDLNASAPETVDLLCSLALMLRPTVIVEAGTYLGHAVLSLAVLCARALIPAHLYTADIFDRYAHGMQAQAIAPLGVADRVTFYLGSYDEMLVRHDVRGIGLAYLDASAPERPAMRYEHLQLTKSRMAPEGLIVIDDLNGEWPHAEELRVTADLYLPQGRGLGIFRAAEA
jgi:predicted O-methyltransferase YrrM